MDLHVKAYHFNHWLLSLHNLKYLHYSVTFSSRGWNYFFGVCSDLDLEKSCCHAAIWRPCYWKLLFKKTCTCTRKKSQIVSLSNFDQCEVCNINFLMNKRIVCEKDNFSSSYLCFVLLTSSFPQPEVNWD